jgi:signal peptidase I
MSAIPSVDTTKAVVPASRGSRAGRLLRDTLEAALLAVVLFFVLQTAVQNTVVEGQSMAPNFLDRQHVLVNKLAYRRSGPQRGDVVVFHTGARTGKDFIKRVIGLPGETVSMSAGRVFIDGRLLAEPWEPLFDDTELGAYTVPAGRYFVLGDNRANSNDSRVFGTAAAASDQVEPAIASAQIVGRVWLAVWPTSRWGVVRADEPAPNRHRTF